MRSRVPALSSLLLLALALATGGCLGTPPPVEPPAPVRVGAPPLAAAEEVAMEPLLDELWLSAYAVAVDGEVGAHVHLRHEETVYVLEGRGRMLLGDTWHDVGAGDLIHVPRGTPHAFVSDGPATALSLFTPNFDGADRIWVEAPRDPGGEAVP